MIRATAGFLLILLLTGCGPSEPVRIGFIAGLTGHLADFGLPGRNGALLAVEQRNQAGGILGRKIELLIRDDTQTSEVAVKAVRELVAARVEVIIGPMTSSMVDAALPVAEQAGIVMISPTSAAFKFSGQDDQFFRLASTMREYGQAAAKFHYQQRGLRRVAIAYDINNKVFSDSALNEFRTAFVELGGVVPVAVAFDSAKDPIFADIIRALLQAQPDALLFISGAVDTVRLAQQARKLSPELPLIATEWAATEQLIELGGRVVEGLYLGQFFNRNDASPHFQTFRDAYRARFQQEPGYTSIAGYDAVNVVLDALSRRSEHQSLKDAMLSGAFQGAQHTIVFDRFGDTQRPTYTTIIRNGRFVIVE